MNELFLQVVVSIWLSVHPVTITLPKIYMATNGGACREKADAVTKTLEKHSRRKNLKVEAWCEVTDKREL